jgi:hypothetical protein
MKISCQSQTVTINQLKIDGTALTKTKLCGLQVIRMIRALEMLLYKQVSIVAKYPIALYIKSATESANLLQVTPDLPDSDIIRKYQDTPNQVCGVILYDHENAVLLNSWLVAEEYITSEMYQADQAIKDLSVAVNRLRELNEFDVPSLASALGSAKKYLRQPKAKRYALLLLVSESNLSRGSHKDVQLPQGPSRQNLQETMSWEESELAFNNISVTKEVSDKDELRTRWDILELKRKVNEDWRNAKLEKPYDMKDWVDTKCWLLNEVETELVQVSAEHTRLEKLYEDVMQAYQQAPMITL